MLSPEEKNIAENVKRLMAEKELSLRQLEERSGINHSTIHSFLHRGNSPRVAAVSQIAKALDVSFEDLLKPSKQRREKAIA